MSSEDADIYRSAMNEDELINFLDQVEFSLHLTPKAKRIDSSDCV